MNRPTGTIGALMLGVLCVLGALAHAEPQTRTFRDRRGRQLTAEVIEVGHDKVKLRTKEGIKVFSLADFSDADRTYLRTLLESRQAPGKAAQPAAAAAAAPADAPADGTVDMERVLDIAFSPDGKYIAAATIYGKTDAAIWRADDGTLVNTLKDVSRSARGLRTITFDPKSTTVVTGSMDYGVAALLGVPTGVEIQRFVHNKLGFLSLPVSKRRQDEFLRIHDVAFSPDGTRLVVGAGYGESVLFMWDTQSGKMLHCERIGERSGIDPIAIAVSGDSHLIACVGPWEDSRGSAIVWDMATMKRRHVLRGKKYERVEALAFSPKQPLLATSFKTRIVLWNTETGEEVRSLRASVSSSLEFSSDGKRLVSGSKAQGIAVYDVGTGRKVWVGKATPGISAQVNAVAFHPDGKRVAAGTQDGRVICWDTEAGGVLWTVHGRR